MLNRVGLFFMSVRGGRDNAEDDFPFWLSG